MATIRNLPKFEYLPLKSPRHIRLITIEASSGPDDPVVVSFTSTSLQRPCEYQTLSYTWGAKLMYNLHLTQTVLCNGRQLPVTINLHNFLKRFRSQSRDRFRPGSCSHLPIWIDALCIDQDNLSERSEQVAIMGEIYGCSSQLNVWLGEFDIPGSIGHPFVPRPTGKVVVEPDGLMVENMVTLPWFERRWVVQEVLHTWSANRTIWIGNREISWNDFTNLAQRSITTPVPEILNQRRKVQKGGWTGDSFLKNMEHYGHTLCDDPRDYIYALLSISKDREIFEIDYQSNAEVIYRRVAERIAEHAPPDYVAALLIAAIARSRGVRNQSPPFWVPRWCDRRAHMTPDEKKANTYALQSEPYPAWSSTRASVIGLQYLRLRVWLFARGRGQDIFSVQHNHTCEGRRGLESRFDCPQCKADLYNNGLMYPQKRPKVKDQQVLCVLKDSTLGFVLQEYANTKSEGMLYRPISFFKLEPGHYVYALEYLGWELTHILIT